MRALARIDRLDIDFIDQRRARGFSDSAIAQMGGWCVSDVESIPRYDTAKPYAIPRIPLPRRLPEVTDFPDVVEALTHICEQYGVTLADIIGPSHLPEHVGPRHEAFAVAFEMNRFTLRELGQIFRKDHNAVIYGIKRHYERLRTERDWS